MELKLCYKSNTKLGNDLLGCEERASALMVMLSAFLHRDKRNSIELKELSPLEKEIHALVAILGLIKDRDGLIANSVSSLVLPGGAGRRTLRTPIAIALAQCRASLAVRFANLGATESNPQRTHAPKRKSQEEIDYSETSRSKKARSDETISVVDNAEDQSSPDSVILLSDDYQDQPSPGTPTLGGATGAVVDAQEFDCTCGGIVKPSVVELVRLEEIITRVETTEDLGASSQKSVASDESDSPSSYSSLSTSLDGTSFEEAFFNGIFEARGK